MTGPTAMGPSPARRAAFAALRTIASGVDLPHALARTRDLLTDGRDRGLASDIVTGTIRWRAALDHLIVHQARRSLAQIDPGVLDVLRLSAYQLTHLTRVPARAVVDDAVELARLAGRPSAAGFVNAVLRGLATGGGHGRLPGRPDNTPGAEGADLHREARLDYLATTLSHPRWLVERWLDRFGFEAAEQWARFNNTPGPMTLCANRSKCDREQLATMLADLEIRAHPARFAPGGLVVEHGRAAQSPPVEAGLALIQDESSQLVVEAVGARPGERILDVCASPGGKTVGLASAVGARGLVVASDLRPGRVELLTRTLTRCVPGPFRVVRLDASRPLPFHSRFDCVVLDAPCSGLGTLRRDPDLKWRRRESDLGELAGRQGEMIRRAAEVVAPGGRLVYATCSSEPEENDAVVESFLRGVAGFALIDRAVVLSHLPPDCEPMVDARGLFRTLPHRDGLEAFFAALLVRER